MLNEEHKQFNLSVGQKIKSRRLELKKTQSWLAKKIGVTFQQVQMTCNNTNFIIVRNFYVATIDFNTAHL